MTPGADGAPSAPSLSIVVTSYGLDRAGDIDELLDALAAQDCGPAEVVFVAEGSALAAHVRSHRAAQRLGLRVIDDPAVRGISAARSRGVQAARGSLVAFIDDDAIPAPGWCAALYRAFEDEGVIAISGPARPRWVGEPAAWFPRELYWVLGCTAWSASDSPRALRNVWGMNMAFRREAFERAGTFGEHFGGVHGRRLHGEEVELSLRIRRVTGKRIVYVPELAVEHKVYPRRLSLRWIARTSYWTGYTRRQLNGLSRRYGLDDGFLDVERSLLGRILGRLVPRTLAALPRRPRQSLRVLATVALTLGGVGAGYCTHLVTTVRGAGDGD